MFESLTQKLLVSLRSIGNRTRLTEDVVDEVCRQLKTNLLEADVHVKVAKDFIDGVRKKALGTEVQKSLSPEQQFIRIVYEELCSVMGGKNTPLSFRVRPPAVILVVGLQGAGKTTTLVKLAKHIREVHKKSLLVASVDVYRPAAIEQLATQIKALGYDHFDCPVMEARPRAVLAKEEAIKQNAEVLLIDTAGRLHIDSEMMAELQELVQVFSPIEILLVIDSMTGQDAVKIATQFQETLPISGIVLTKMDGDARGGAALSVRAVTGCPIKFVGMGEKASDLELFHPDRVASRILDMGDLLSLAEKAESTFDKEETLKLSKKIKKNDFTLADFYGQLQQIKKMGSFENLLKFLPGSAGLSKQIQTLTPPDTEIKKIEAIIQSMTPSERVDYDLLDGSRRRRIAAGSGTRVEDINKLMKQFLEARKMMTRLAKSPMGKRRGLW
ncbi:signal recognition particle protein [bacterium]|nr:signal recognition particle protein [bacterium]NBX82351.1 signal recognition particle protein [bacterium]